MTKENFPVKAMVWCVFSETYGVFILPSFCLDETVTAVRYVEMLIERLFPPLLARCIKRTAIVHQDHLIETSSQSVASKIAVH